MVDVDNVQTTLSVPLVLLKFSGTFQALIQFADALSAYNAKTVSKNFCSV